MADIARIYSPPSLTPQPTPTAPGPTPPPKTDTSESSWFSKLMTMFPVEAVTVYTAGIQYFSTTQGQTTTSGGAVWLVLTTLVAMLIVRSVALRPATGGPTNYRALVVTGVSFLLWVGATADISLANDVQRYMRMINTNAGITQSMMQHFSGFFIVIWTWVMPNIVKLTA